MQKSEELGSALGCCYCQDAFTSMQVGVVSDQEQQDTVIKTREVGQRLIDTNCYGLLERDLEESWKKDNQEMTVQSNSHTTESKYQCKHCEELILKYSVKVIPSEHQQYSTEELIAEIAKNLLPQQDSSLVFLNKSVQEIDKGTQQQQIKDLQLRDVVLDSSKQLQIKAQQRNNIPSNFLNEDENPEDQQNHPSNVTTQQVQTIQSKAKEEEVKNGEEEVKNGEEHIKFSKNQPNQQGSQLSEEIDPDQQGSQLSEEIDPDQQGSQLSEETEEVDSIWTKSFTVCRDTILNNPLSTVLLTVSIILCLWIAYKVTMLQKDKVAIDAKARVVPKTVELSDGNKVWVKPSDMALIKLISKQSFANLESMAESGKFSEFFGKDFVDNVKQFARYYKSGAGSTVGCSKMVYMVCSPDLLKKIDAVVMGVTG